MASKEKSKTPNVKKRPRGIRGVKGRLRSTMVVSNELLTKIRKIEEVVADDEDPFEDCDAQSWTLKTVLEQVKKYDYKKGRCMGTYLDCIKGVKLTPYLFTVFPNSLIVILFRVYSKLEPKLQKMLHQFYTNLEQRTPFRFRNLTNSMHAHNIFQKYPWLTKNEALRRPIDANTNKKKKQDELKPFSEACKQYEMEKQLKSQIQKSEKIQQYQKIVSAINSEIPVYKLTPMMHFESRKIKLTSLLPLSLGDLIVLVSYFYKLEYDEQQILIEKMKKLETSKPNQASYLRLYVRTTCPTNENEIVFKPLPQELILSENLDYEVTCIEDILENDFCVFDDKQTNNTNDFDFGSAFL